MTAAWTTEEVARLRLQTPGCATVAHFKNAGASLPPMPVLETHLAARAALMTRRAFVPWAALVVCAAALALAACSAPTFSYERRGATPAQVDHDLAQCKKEAFRPSRFAIWSSGRYDTDVLNRCMTRKGYAVRPDPTR